MGTDKRDRQKANRAAKLEAERIAAAKAKRNQTIRGLVVLVVVVLIVAVIFGLAGCGSSAGSDAKGAGDQAATTTTAADGGTASGAKASYGTGECAPAEGVDEPVLTFDDAPKQCIDPDKTYTATIETSEGTVVVALDTETTPITTNNFVNLARSKYFDDTELFRTEAATGIIQGGSPHTQDNSDQGPGYDIPDEGMPFGPEDYAPGVIAMANAGPGTAGSQFFFVSQEAGSYLGDPDQIGPSAGLYAVFGKATEGLDVLQKISDLEDPAAPGTPRKPVTIESVTIEES
jgi:cyclophilin family peptidyl-prolyl cis-trans isomerase